MKLFSSYDSPAISSRAFMAVVDLLSRLFILRQPSARLPLSPEDTPRLLLLRLDGVGDNVCSWPALELLRRKLPHSRISLAVGPWAAPLYKECPWIDEVIEWDSGLFGYFRGKGIGGLLHDLNIAKELRHKGFSAGIDLRGDLLSITLLRMIAPPVRVSTVTRGGRRFLTDPLQVNGKHETERAVEIISASLGLPAVPSSRLKDWARPEALERAREKLMAAGWNESLPTTALSPLALWHWKQWPKERFRELAGRLKNELGMQIVWFLENAQQGEDYNSGDPVFCGPLDEVASALSLCTLAVANDSGLMHLAVAAGCMTVQLFGPGDAACFAHRGEGLAVHHDTSCRHYPCNRTGECSSQPDGWCMDKITTEEVLTSCVTLMQHCTPNEKCSGH